MNKNFITNCRPTVIAIQQDSAAGDHPCNIIDMQGFSGVQILASIDTPDTANGIKIRWSETLDQAGELENPVEQDPDQTLVSSVYSDGTQKQLLLDVYKPMQRYIQVIVDRATATAVDAVWAIQYAPKTQSVTLDTENQASHLVISPGIEL